LQVAEAHHNEQPTMLVSLGDRIHEGQAVMRVARVVHQFSNFRKTVRLGQRDSDAEFDAILREVHDEAVRSIRERTPGGYADINDVYEQALLALPETWATYGQQFAGAVAAGQDLFEFTVLNRIEDRLRNEIDEAVRSGNREIAEEALNLPIVVAMRSQPLNAIGLSGRMLQLFVEGVGTLVRLPHGDFRRITINWSLLRLSEHARVVEYQYFH
jgi:hypothetical protein